MMIALKSDDRQTPAAETLLRRVRVMIVDDSRVIREFLTHVIGSDPRLEIVASVESGEEALRALDQASPDVISMDIRLPGMDGFEATRRIMMTHPTPIVVVAADAEESDSRISIDALQAGALSVLAKPASMSHENLEAFTERLCTQLAIMSQVRVITQRSNGRAAGTVREPVRPMLPPPFPGGAVCEMVGIVASTGGPNALLEIMKGLGGDFAAPILLVQHMTGSFMRAFVDWLNDVCPLRVVLADDAKIPEPGCVYVAPADRHLALRGRQLRLEATPLVSLQRPSGTVLLDSMGESLGGSAVGVLLTGMGDDGAKGLGALRAAGGHAIAEHESTAVVYGMPGAAVAMGAVTESLPLQMIAPRLRQLVRR